MKRAEAIYYIEFIAVVTAFVYISRVCIFERATGVFSQTSVSNNFLMKIYFQKMRFIIAITTGILLSTQSYAQNFEIFDDSIIIAGFRNSVSVSTYKDSLLFDYYDQRNREKIYRYSDRFDRKMSVKDVSFPLIRLTFDSLGLQNCFSFTNFYGFRTTKSDLSNVRSDYEKTKSNIAIQLGIKGIERAELSNKNHLTYCEWKTSKATLKLIKLENKKQCYLALTLHSNY